MKVKSRKGWGIISNTGTFVSTHIESYPMKSESSKQTLWPFIIFSSKNEAEEWRKSWKNAEEMKTIRVTIVPEKDT